MFKDIKNKGNVTTQVVDYSDFLAHVIDESNFGFIVDELEEKTQSGENSPIETIVALKLQMPHFKDQDTRPNKITIKVIINARTPIDGVGSLQMEAELAPKCDAAFTTEQVAAAARHVQRQVMNVIARAREHFDPENMLFIWDEVFDWNN